MNKIFLVCTGLGRINRGYETFTKECFDALTNFDKTHEYHLFQGGGKAENGRTHVVSNLHRWTSLAKQLANLIGKDAYFIEQLTFFFFFIPSLFLYRPKVIFFSDFILGTFLFRFRKMTGFEYKLVFSNGAPNGPPFSRCDLVQQLLPCYYEQAIIAGESKESQILLPYGVKMPDDVSFVKQSLRDQLGIPNDSFVVLSVGAINGSHKRMHYLIDEVTKVIDRRIFLIILGQPTEETAEIIQKANTQLSGRYFTKNVKAEDVGKYYQAADCFVLCSLLEGFGRVYMEALAYGLPVIAHDYPVARQVMHEHAIYIDMTQNGALAAVLSGIEESSDNKGQRVAFVRDTYGWDNLSIHYVTMLKNSYLNGV